MLPTAKSLPASFRKALKVTLALVLLLLIVGFVLVRVSGLWGILFPSHQHDTVAPVLPELHAPAILVFSKTNSFRHVDGIEGGGRALKAIAGERDWDVFATENGAVFNDTDLGLYQAVVFLNATGDMLSERQELAFQRWLEAGGGWLGIHAAGDGSHSGWRWYRDNLIGADFTAHILGPQFQVASVIMEAPDHPLARQIPTTWEHEEEWYSWAESPRTEGFTIVATVDESSYSPYQKILGRETDLRMGDHPVVWSRCVGRGRAAYAAMGHSAETFDNPVFRDLLGNALSWAVGEVRGECQASKGGR
ncbi:MAG: ThuA domain-containing protein [Halieaceae bacterium]|nr:ThuA domain-containing protein [Halieaceae bacterium]